jgi:hypothetical protein
MSTDDDERISYLEGEAVGSLGARERAELDELRALLQAPATWAEPDPILESRVVQAIAEEAGAEPRGAQVRAPRFRLRSILRRPTYALSAAAALAAATIVVVVAIAGGASGRGPQRLAMVVSGTSLAPAAHGSAQLTKTASGWRIELSATGLPHLANGRYYEAWLKNAAGVLVPVGTFNDARHVTLWAGVPATSFRVLTVTRQQANGNPASSGKRVLTGRIVHPG